MQGKLRAKKSINQLCNCREPYLHMSTQVIEPPVGPGDWERVRRGDSVPVRAAWAAVVVASAVAARPFHCGSWGKQRRVTPAPAWPMALSTAGVEKTGGG